MKQEQNNGKLINCFFNERLLADGKPYKISLHKITGIEGGTGPSGSIGSTGKTVFIPRSRYAERAHTMGRTIKLFTLGIAALFFLYGTKSSLNIYLNIIFSIGVLLIGGGMCQLFYRYLGVKSTSSHATLYPEVRQLMKKGYQRGFHPLLSTTPFGIVIYLIRFII